MSAPRAKSPQAFRTITEAAVEVGVPAHVLRFWEGKFHALRPMKRAGGRRLYRPEDMALLHGLKALLHAEGYTIKGVQKLFKEQGIAFIRQAGADAHRDAPASFDGHEQHFGRDAHVWDEEDDADLHDDGLDADVIATMRTMDAPAPKPVPASPAQPRTGEVQPALDNALARLLAARARIERVLAAA